MVNVTGAAWLCSPFVPGPPKEEAAPGEVEGVVRLDGFALFSRENGLVTPGFIGPNPLGAGISGFSSEPPFAGDVPGGNPLGAVRKEGSVLPGVAGTVLPGIEGTVEGTPPPGVAGPVPGAACPEFGCDGLLGFPELLPLELESPGAGEAPKDELAPFEEEAAPEES